MAEIADYAAIGNCRTMALVSKSASIEWLCLPRFDNEPLFAALVNEEAGGCWCIRPKEAYTVDRYYLDGSCVLVTEFRTESGCVSVTDWMAASGEDPPRGPEAQHELRRLVHGLEGEVEMEVVFKPTKDFGRHGYTFKDRGAFGIESIGNNFLLRLRSQIPLRIAEGGASATCDFTIREDEEVHFAFACSSEAPDVIPALGHGSWVSMEQTCEAWRHWVAPMNYRGRYKDDVCRSLLTLKMLTFAPSGAVVAAPTTSLPEAPHSSMNWDYRYCWLRDAAYTMRAYIGLGFYDEAKAFENWLLHSTRLSWPKLKIMYDVFGRDIPNEKEMYDLSGFDGALPVRTGNAANSQVQLDVYGEIIDSAATYIAATDDVDAATRQLLVRTGEYICRNWEQPDHGIWELRGERRHYVHSKLMAWVALDRLLTLHEQGHLGRRFPKERFELNRHLIAQSIHAHGWNEKAQAYTQSYGSDVLDASVLLMVMYGFEDGRSKRMRSTYEAIERQLGDRGMLYRFSSDDLKEGAFGICSFWAVEYLAYCGMIDEAHERFQTLLGYANDLGLYSEEEDPESHLFLGNFPQAFTHIGLINAALTLERAENQALEEPRVGDGQYQERQESERTSE